MNGALASARMQSPEHALPADGQIAYKVPHAAQVLDIGLRTMWGLIEDGEVDSFKIGRSRLITRAALLAYVERLQAQAAGELTTN